MAKYFTRKKPNPFLLRLCYLIDKWSILKNRKKLNLYLDLEWIFARLARTTANKYYTDLDDVFGKNINEFILRKINGKHHVLDLGCGLGKNSFLIAKRAASVTGIDYDNRNIEIAKSRFNLSNLKFINNEALTFLNSSKEHFDVLILSHIIEHLENQKDFLLNFKSFFKLIYIEVPDLEASNLNLFRVNLNSNFQYTDDDHVVEFDRTELIEVLHACNLKIIDCEYIYGVQKYWCSVN